MTEPTAASQTGHALPQGFCLRVPALRRPPGWRSLDERALRARATQLYLANRLPPLPVVDGAAARAPAPAAGDLSEVSGSTEPHPQPVAVATPAAAPGSPRQAHWHLLPWAVMVGGFVVLTPWLIWAPVVGGLCMGLLLLQGGLVKHWVSARQRADQEPGADAVPSHRPAPESGPIQAVHGLESRQLKFANPGWLLAAVLVLVGVQAAMLFTTVQIKSHEPAAVAGALRAAQAGRGTAPRPVGETVPAKGSAEGQPDIDQRTVEPAETAGKRVKP